MKKLLLFMTILLIGFFAASYFKNQKIAEEIAKQLDTVQALKHGGIHCTGLVKADCEMQDIVYQDTRLAESVTLKGIDPLVQFHEGNFIEIPVEAEIKNAKFSLFDISSLLKNDIQKELKNFFSKYTKNYDISIKANFLTDGKRVRDIDIVDVDAQDKITPFLLKGKVSAIDTFPILDGFYAKFDFTNKRLVFYDFLDEMRRCCIKKFPERYLKMSNEAIWNDIVMQISAMLTMNLKNQFIQEGERDMMRAMLDILQDKKNYLVLDVKAKKKVPLEQTVMQFFIAGPDAVKAVYDMKIEAK